MYTIKKIVKGYPFFFPSNSYKNIEFEQLRQVKAIRQQLLILSNSYFYQSSLKEDWILWTYSQKIARR